MLSTKIYSEETGQASMARVMTSLQKLGTHQVLPLCTVEHILEGVEPWVWAEEVEEKRK